MADPFIGEIQIFGFNFAPRGWAFCAGQIVPIQQNTTLFSLIGVNYGGNGTSNFALPDFAQRAACNQGQGRGLTLRDIGEPFGSNSVTLLDSEMPRHTHPTNVYASRGTDNRFGTPQQGYSLLPPSTASAYIEATADTPMHPLALQPQGGSQPHENRQPFLALTYCISLAGAFPQFD